MMTRAPEAKPAVAAHGQMRNKKCEKSEATKR
jgi:hypothetical protein